MVVVAAGLLLTCYPFAEASDLQLRAVKVLELETPVGDSSEEDAVVDPDKYIGGAPLKTDPDLVSRLNNTFAPYFII